jgi:predicted RNA-binding protein (virulence factor B family)
MGYSMENIKGSHISHSIEMGKINMLAVTRIIEFGLVLRNHNGDEEVLLPNAYVTEEMKELGQAIEVFVYTDSEDRRVATTERPLAMEGELGYFEVVDFKSYGAFVDWGLPKDLFVPLSQQKAYFQIGKKVILRVALDEETGRLYGSQKIGRWLEESVGLTPSQKVEALVIAQTPMGYKIVIDNRFEAMLYSNEIFEPITIGERKTVYIKAIRPDGKVDCSLQPIGKQAQVSAGEKRILEILKEKGGAVPVTTKSSPEEIEKMFGMSKKMFKATVNPMLVEGRLKVEGGELVVSS